MAIKFYGSFNTYVPTPEEGKPRTLLVGVLFSRNAHLKDFYDIKEAIPEDALVVLTGKDASVVQAASKGPLMAFPQSGQRLYAIHPAPDGVTPEGTLGKTLDPETGELS